jgi:hypothetical protein
MPACKLHGAVVVNRRRRRRRKRESVYSDKGC